MRALLVLLVVASAAWACPVSERRIGVSPNGHFRVITDYPARLELWRGNGRSWGTSIGPEDGVAVWRQPLAGEMPSFGFVADDGSRVVTVADDLVQVWNARGELQGQNRVDLLGDSPRAGWLSGELAYVETAAGRLLEYDCSTGFSRELAKAELLPVLERGEAPAAALRLAVIHHLRLQAPWVAGMARSANPEARVNLAVYLGDRRRVAGFQECGEQQVAREEWAPWLQGAAFRGHSTYYLGSGPVVAGILSAADFLPLLEQPGQAQETAIQVFSRLPCPAAVPGLLKILDKPADRYAHQGVVEAIAFTQRERAAPALRSRLAGPAREAICWYFERVFHRQAVPELIEALPASRAALCFQTRADLGASPDPWRKWWATRHYEAGGPGGPLWKARAGQDLGLGTRMVAVLRSHAADSLAWRDNRRLHRLSGDEFAPELAWDTETQEVVARLPEGVRPWAYQLSRDGSTLGISDRHLTFWREGRPWQTPDGQLEQLSADGRWALTYRDAGRVLVNLSDHTEQALPDEYLGFSPSGRYLVGDKVRALDGTSAPIPPEARYEFRSMGMVTCLDRQTGSLKHLASTNNTYWHEVTPAPDGLVAAWDDEHVLRVIDLEGRRLNPPGQACTELAWAPDGLSLAVADHEGITVYDTRSWHSKATILLPMVRISSLALSPDSRFVAAGMADGAIRVWDLQPPSMEGSDSQLASELATGMRLEGGAAVLLSPEAYRERSQRWLRSEGTTWFYGARPFRLPPLENVMASIALLLLLGLWAAVRRRKV